MILLDTHIWVWWVHGDDQLPPGLRAALQVREPEGLAVSAISTWEVAKLVELGRLEVPEEISNWMALALDGSGITVVPITPAIAIASTSLPGSFHRDPADQIIVATARMLDMQLATADSKIRAYPYAHLVDEMRIHDE